MASEYLLKQAREQAPPEAKRELTPKEELQNWWYYHKWYVIVGAIVIMLLGLMIRDIFFNPDPKPDYQIAYIGSSYLPEDTVLALEEALAELGEDRNQDGQVLVALRQYPLYAEMDINQTSVAAQVQLTVDVEDYKSFIYLMEDPETFQDQFEILAYPDGTIPEDGVFEGIWYAWEDCPVLMGLELGSYTEYTMNGEVIGDNQQLLSGLYIARRETVSDKDPHDFGGVIAFWEKLTRDARFQ